MNFLVEDSPVLQWTLFTNGLFVSQAHAVVTSDPLYDLLTCHVTDHMSIMHIEKAEVIKFMI